MPETTSRNRPNILWILLEDTSPRFGCYGDDIARTPTIDQLASEGRRFPNTFCMSPVCSPSRSAIHTGCYQTAIGSQHHRTSQPTGFRPRYEAVPPHYIRFLSEYLRQEGYFCAMAGSTDFCHATPISAFDECSSPNLWDDGRPDWMVEDAHWRHRPDDAPFFAVFNPAMTHESGMWTREERVAQAVEFGGDPENIPEEPLITDPDAVELPPYLPDTEPSRRALARHYDNLHEADEVVATLLEELETAGVADDTIVFLFSDHGEGMPRGKRWVHDSGTRVPMIVRDPGRIDGGTVDHRLVSLVDVAPTVLSLAGIDIPTHMDGTPFTGPDSEPREYVFTARDRHDEFHDTVRAVRTRNFRYVRNYYPGTPYVLQNQYRNRHPIMQEILRLRAAGELTGAADDWASGRRPPEELYDLREDPHEVNNLMDNSSYADVANRLREALDDWIAHTDDRGLEPEDQEVKRMWPNGEQPATAPPVFVPNDTVTRGTERVSEGKTLQGPAEIQFYCPTQGASIVYKIADRDGHWNLVTGPLRLSEGETTLRARAVRYGYTESEEQQATFVVEE